MKFAELQNHMLNTRVWPMPICVVGWDQRPKICGLSVSFVLTSSLERWVCSAIFCILVGYPQTWECAQRFWQWLSAFFAPTRAHPHRQRCLGLSVSWMSKQQLVLCRRMMTSPRFWRVSLQRLWRPWILWTTWTRSMTLSWLAGDVWTSDVLLVVVPSNQKIIQVGLFTRMKRTELPDRECGRFHHFQDHCVQLCW